MPSVILLPVSPVDRTLIDALVAPLRAELGISISIEEKNTLNPSFAFDLKRNQHNSTAILAAMLQKYPDTHVAAVALSIVEGRQRDIRENPGMVLSANQGDANQSSRKILAVTGLDLFVPVLTYVFGEAQLSGKAAVVSTFRLDETLYGLPANRPLLEERLLKEAVHELGHTFGLIHCRNYECAMHSSTAAEEIDIKGKGLCEECRKAIKN